jgi:amino acid transporter
VREKNFFPFSSGLFFFFFFIRKEKKRKRGEKRSILAPLFSPIWGFSSFFFILFFGFARMCRLFYPREENPGRSFFHSGARMYLLSRMCSRRTTRSGRKGERGGS